MKFNLLQEAVEHLLMMGGNVHARDDGGLIPLHNACSFGHAEVVSLLLSAGADPNARDSWSCTPLHEAAVKGKVDVCIMLLQHGADPNLRCAFKLCLRLSLTFLHNIL